jgi:hypothetical protein
LTIQDDGFAGERHGASITQYLVETGRFAAIARIGNQFKTPKSRSAVEPIVRRRSSLRGYGL